MNASYGMPGRVRTESREDFQREYVVPAVRDKDAALLDVRDGLDRAYTEVGQDQRVRRVDQRARSGRRDRGGRHGFIDISSVIKVVTDFRFRPQSRHGDRRRPRSPKPRRAPRPYDFRRAYRVA
jgi:hypothetical protein